MRRAAFLGAVLVAALFVAPVARADDMQDLVAQAALDEGASPGVLVCMAWRESRMDPNAVSPWGDLGLMQFHRQAGGWTLMQLTPWADASPFDPDAAAHAAAWLIVRGYGPRWSTYWGCA